MTLLMLEDQANMLVIVNGARNLAIEATVTPTP
jgi:hypothetical protein